MPTFTSQPNLKLCMTSDKVNMYIITKQENNKLNLFLQNLQTVYIQRPVDRRFPAREQGGVHIHVVFCVQCSTSLSAEGELVGQMCRIATYRHDITTKPSTIQDPQLAAGAHSVFSRSQFDQAYFSQTRPWLSFPYFNSV